MRSVWNRILLVSLLTIFSAGAKALAHPGHGVTPAESAWHGLIEPQHGALWQWEVIAVALLTVPLIWLGQRLRRRLPAVVDQAPRRR